MSRKKAKQDEPKKTPRAFGRVELQAAPEWIAELDAMAKAMGMSRSAYVRMACNLKMASDRKALSGQGGQ